MTRKKKKRTRDMDRITLRLEHIYFKQRKKAYEHYYLDDFHCYVKMLIRRDMKGLIDNGIVDGPIEDDEQ